jgi:hypothetical protein
MVNPGAEEELGNVLTSTANRSKGMLGIDQAIPERSCKVSREAAFQHAPHTAYCGWHHLLWEGFPRLSYPTVEGRAAEGRKTLRSLD